MRPPGRRPPAAPLPPSAWSFFGIRSLHRTNPSSLHAAHDWRPLDAVHHCDRLKPERVTKCHQPPAACIRESSHMQLHRPCTLHLHPPPSSPFCKCLTGRRNASALSPLLLLRFPPPTVAGLICEVMSATHCVNSPAEFSESVPAARGTLRGAQG